MRDCRPRIGMEMGEKKNEAKNDKFVVNVTKK